MGEIIRSNSNTTNQMIHLRLPLETTQVYIKYLFIHKHKILPAWYPIALTALYFYGE